MKTMQHGDRPSEMLFHAPFQERLSSVNKDKKNRDHEHQGFMWLYADTIHNTLVYIKG